MLGGEGRVTGQVGGGTENKYQPLVKYELWEKTNGCETHSGIASRYLPHPMSTQLNMGVISLAQIK